jgi:hypothetical protein
LLRESLEAVEQFECQIFAQLSREGGTIRRRSLRAERPAGQTSGALFFNLEIETMATPLPVSAPQQRGYFMSSTN